MLLKKEGTEKYQLEERDDWRYLVESLTADRKNLNKQIEVAVKVSDDTIAFRDAAARAKTIRWCARLLFAKRRTNTRRKSNTPWRQAR